MRGDVHVLKAPRGTRGAEQGGQRFAVVVQSDLLPLSTWIVAPTSTGAREARFRPSVLIGEERTLILTEQIAAVDPSRLGPLVGHLSREDLDALDAALKLVLDLG
ncbi:MAG: type II toxin-antitoxin system PemK/MazF family toxin [Candidatus Phosphoribacter baldrii]